jgi:hypothetical protein
LPLRDGSLIPRRDRVSLSPGCGDGLADLGAVTEAMQRREFETVLGRIGFDEKATSRRSTRGSGTWAGRR